MQRLIILILLMITFNLSAQMQKFPLLEPINNAIPESFIVEGGEDELIMFWIDSTDLHVSKSLDDGTTWGTLKTLVDNTNLIDSLSDLNVLKLNNGRILVTYKFKLHYAIHSDDNGETWSAPSELKTEGSLLRKRGVNSSSLSQTDDGKVWLVYNRLKVIYNIKSDDGITWSERDTVAIMDNGSAHYSSVNLNWDNSLVLIYQLDEEEISDIYQSVSLDSGKTWTEPNLVIDNGTTKTRPRVAKDADGSLWLTYVEEETTPFEEYFQSNIYYSKLANGANSWGTPINFVEYVGFDGWQNISFTNSKLYITYTSNRTLSGLSFWFGILEETNDGGAAPAIFETKVKYQNDYPKINLNITAKVFDSNEIDSVLFHYEGNDEIVNVLQLFDDGLHGDKNANDFIFGNDILGLSSGITIDKFYSAVDVNGNRTITTTENIKSPFGGDGGESFVFDNNNIKFPINSSGILADVGDDYDNRGARFDDNRFIYSAGFALSGYTNGELWSNGVITTSNVIDYTAGPLENPQPYHGIYIVRSSQPDFFQSWIDWEEAVMAGAEYYDGDGDGVYNPVDKNENGLWDTDEDKPNIIGDITAFAVFNDGVISQDRTFDNVEPQGIEIKQTVFSYNKKTSPKLSNVIFVRYSIENMGTVADQLDSVYFGAWADLDLGEPYSDLFGTDRTLNSAYTYNDGADERYGINPPACFVSFIQGPPVYINGETYEDANGNGVYDEGVDTPLDSAFNRKGELLSIDEFPGAKNNGLTASIHYIAGHPIQGNPDNESELRSNLLGQNQQGELIDPCMWPFGEVFNEDCNLINPRLMYGGDPVSQNGWVNTYDADQKQLGSTGPFDLIKDKPIEIIIAYIVGRGTDALNSITEARRITKDAIGFYNTNFSYVPVGVNDKPEVQIPTEYNLSQNYPNPFNPSTTIKYSIANVVTSRDLSLQHVVLKIYDILGREVATLVNKQQKAGSYEVSFNASNLTSGVYFYQLHAYPSTSSGQASSVSSYMESKKMILLK